ncbi:hypothetical protein GCM10009547_31780 [Sporichthya brevicatena]|uniref:Uncharacterized protein n=1 Tax=Sporichthya brevicatena TaxID=171442 RepID=A0ABN1H1G7_9ACTN
MVDEVVVPAAEQGEVVVVGEADIAPVLEVVAFAVGDRAGAAGEDAAGVADADRDPLGGGDGAAATAELERGAVLGHQQGVDVGVAADPADGFAGEVLAGAGAAESGAQGLGGGGDDQPGAFAVGGGHGAVADGLVDDLAHGVGPADLRGARVGVAVLAGAGCVQGGHRGLEFGDDLVGVAPGQGLGAVVVVADVGGAAFGGDLLPGEVAVGVDGVVDALGEQAQVLGVEHLGLLEQELLGPGALLGGRDRGQAAHDLGDHAGLFEVHRPVGQRGGGRRAVLAECSRQAGQPTGFSG